ncbi:MAG: PAS domain-containing sensor histidine kinase [Planctomycetota bacterium]
MNNSADSVHETQKYLDAAAHMFIALDAEGTVRLANTKGCQLLGREKPEILGRNWFDDFLPEDFREDAKTDFRTLMAGTVEPVEYPKYPVVQKDGSQILVVWHNTVLKSAEGRIVGTLISGEDITERRQATGATLESEHRYRSLYNSISEGVALHEMIYDDAGRPVDYRIIDVNPAFESILGIPRDDAIGARASELYGTGKAPYLDIYARVADSNKPESFETTFEPVGKSFRIAVFSSAAGKFATLFADITERKRAEEALRISEKRHRNFLTHNVAGVWRYEFRRPMPLSLPVEDQIEWMMDDGVLVEHNNALARMYGLPDGTNAVGSTHRELHMHDEDDAAEQLRAWIDGGYRFDGDEFFCRIYTGQYRWFLVMGHGVIENDHLIGSWGTQLDITERKRLEEQDRKYQEQLAHISRLTIAGELASGIAHELNQPLHAIAAFSEACKHLIDSGEADSPEVRDALIQISAQAHRGGGIIQRMRDFAGKQKRAYSTTNLNDIVRDAARLVKTSARNHGITFQLDLADGPLTVHVDRIQIEQVIINLIQNGLDSMRAAESSEHRLTVRTARSSPNKVEVAVADTGEGMSDEKIERIFEPFFSTKAEGLGIGLSISRSIVEAHKGQIWAMSNPDRGMTLTFTLPSV